MNKHTSIIFVLGKPGVGKGTQCARFAHEYHSRHLSLGDLLRAEACREDSEYSSIIRQNLAEGAIGPVEMIVAVLKRAMTRKTTENENDNTLFLIDGFPRQLDRAKLFEISIKSPCLVLLLECPQDELVRRLLARQDSNRSDDTIEVINKRFQTFEAKSADVIERYEKLEKLEKIDASQSPEDVYVDFCAAINRRIGNVLVKKDV